MAPRHPFPFRPAFLLVVVPGLFLSAPTPGNAAPRPTVDPAAGTRAAAATLARLEHLSHDPALAAIATPRHVDDRAGVPSFLLATGGEADRARPGVTPEQAAREHLAKVAAYYRLGADDVRDAPLRYVNAGGEGGVVAVFGQEVDGIPVFREEAKVLLGRDLRLLGIFGSIPARSEAVSHAFPLETTDAVAAALTDLTGAPVAKSVLHRIADGAGGYERFEVSSAFGGRLGRDPIRARRVYYRAGEDLLPAYHVELTAVDEAPTYVLAADDGRILLRHDRIAFDTYNYRVWAETSGLQQPSDGPQGTVTTPYPYATPNPDYHAPFLAPPLVSLANGPISTNDPWLPSGATMTSGNNVDSYLSAGTVHATTTSAGTFDRTFDVNQQPDANASQQMAAVTQIFYTTNFLHDWYYDVGFNEAAGNAQVSNYARGGVQGDPIKTLVQVGYTQNASMNTPADGGSPTLNSYIWASGRLSQLKVESPAAIAGYKSIAPDTMNPARTWVTAPVALPFPGTLTTASTTLTVGSSPRFAQIADVSGDGWPDLIVSNASSNNVGVMLNDGSGGFLPQVTYATGNSPRMTVTPDLNQDGLPDLVSANLAGGTITIRLGTGGGAFGPSTALASASGANSVVVGRFNNDAYDDLVVTNASSNNVSIFLGDGAGSFAPRVLYTMGTSPNSVAVGDLNGDGIQDLVAANFGVGSLFMSIRLGTGTGTFGAVVTDTIGNNPQSIALADLNGDGRLDAIAANTGNSTVSVAFGNGNGTFATPVTYALPAAPIGVIAADFNGDGLIDVIATEGTASGTVSLLANNGAGVLAAPQNIAVGATPAGVQLGDLNNDHQPDLAVSNSGAGTVSLLIGTLTPSTSYCPPYANTLTGRIALVPAFDGGCIAETKIAEAQARGAVAVLLEFSVVGNYGGTTHYAIPAFFLSISDGAAMRSQLRGGVAVSATLHSLVTLGRDGAIDNLVVAHEWGHYLSNRLIGNASGLTTNQSGGMGEGWADFSALLLAARPEDAAVPTNANWSGSWGLMQHVYSDSIQEGSAHYFGLRRYPYCTDLAKNPLTFRHISNANPLPVGPPLNNNGAPNSEYHNTGEVWCSALWECYASLLRDAGRLTFTQARDRMRRYLVQSLQLTPVDPTFVEARDALLMAAYATDAVDYQEFRDAFAKRGLGTGAVAPARYSTDNSGVVESFSITGDLKFLTVVVDDSLASCDHDGLLDLGEEGYVDVKLSNPLMSASLPAGTVTLGATSGNLQFRYGNSAPIPASNPGDVVTARIRVLRNQAQIQVDTVSFQYDAPGLPGGARSATWMGWGNIDVSPSANEGFEEATPTPWRDVKLDSRTITESPPWSLVQPDAGSFNHAYNVPMVKVGASFFVKDQTLLSPPLLVGGDPFGFTFQTAYDFYSAPYQGGVVEISTDGGATWSDVGAGSISPGYNTTMNFSGMPLNGRPMFGSTSPGYPSRITETVNLGLAYTGQSVRIRFRAESSNFHAAGGWTIDDVDFFGVSNTPFAQVVEESGSCSLVDVEDAKAPATLAFALEGPNPSHGAPVFRFDLPKAASLTIAVYDVSGRHVATLARGTYSAGVHHVRWVDDTGTHPAGLYFARMESDGRVFSRRIVTLR